MLNSRAVLSSGLYMKASKMGQIDDINLHPQTTEDEALLRRNTRLLLYILFDSGNL